VTVRDADVEYTFDDPGAGWFGMAQPADVTPARCVEEPPRAARPLDTSQGLEHGIEPDDSADTDRWFVQNMDREAPAGPIDPPRDEVDRLPVTESVAATLNVVPTRRNGFVRASAPSSWESRLSNGRAWDFKSTSAGTDHRSKVVVMAAVHSDRRRSRHGPLRRRPGDGGGAPRPARRHPRPSCCRTGRASPTRTSRTGCRRLRPPPSTPTRWPS
jgi:hypothetical protein